MPEVAFAPLMSAMPDWDTEATEVETVDFLLALIAYTHPKCIVEAGTYLGHFAIPAARLASRWGGVVHTWDPVDYGWRSQTELPENLHYHQTNYLLAGLQPDFAFIDSGRPRDTGDRDIYSDDGKVDHAVRLRHIEHTLEHHVPNTLIAVHDMNDAEDWSGGKEVRERAILTFATGRGLSLLVG